MARTSDPPFVIAGPRAARDPAIHRSWLAVFLAMDAQVKPAHDEQYDEVRSPRTFPLPVKRGEGAERSEAGEGRLRALRQPLNRRAAAPLATLSPLHGAREGRKP
jgi:hypothetical protein